MMIHIGKLKFKRLAGSKFYEFLFSLLFPGIPP